MIWHRKSQPTTAMEPHKEAQQHLAEVARRWPEVRRLGAWARTVRQENHFSERIEILIRGGQ